MSTFNIMLFERGEL